MVEVLEVFDGANNIEFKDFTYIKEVGADLVTFTLKEEPAEEWNRKAKIQNTKMFVEIIGRQPKDYQEVLSWIYGENEKSHSAVNTATLATIPNV
jgi:hypothetical protein